jgi:hypothetical protein
VRSLLVRSEGAELVVLSSREAVGDCLRGGRLVITWSTWEAFRIDWSRGVKKCLLGFLSFDRVAFSMEAIELKSSL